MNKLNRYESSSVFKTMLRATTSYCLDNPQQRFPTQNPVADKIRGPRGQNQNNRKAMLMAARHGHSAEQRNRILPWAAPFVGITGWPDEARAQSGLPNSGMDSVLNSLGEWTLKAWDAVDMVSNFDWSHPALGVATGGMIIATQSIGIWQRRKLAQTLRIYDTDIQPDLFPDTVPLAEKAKTWNWQVDAASRQGQVRKENQDAYLILEFGNDLKVLLVFDGAGGVEGGGEAARSGVNSVETHLKEVWDEKGALSKYDLEAAIKNARQKSKASNLTGVTTALLVLLDGEDMHYATLGDGCITIVWPDGMIGPVQVPHHTAGQPSNIINAFIGGDCTVTPRTGSLRLEAGATVLVMSDGASDLFPFDDFAMNREEYQDIAELSDAFLRQLEVARDPDTNAYLHHDNMTLAMAHLTGGCDHD